MRSRNKVAMWLIGIGDTVGQARRLYRLLLSMPLPHHGSRITTAWTIIERDNSEIGDLARSSTQSLFVVMTWMGLGLSSRRLKVWDALKPLRPARLTPASVLGLYRHSSNQGGLLPRTLATL